MKVKINEIMLNDTIYPRKQKSKVTIENYKEAYECGAIFPPLLVQKIKNGKDEEEILLLDGYHRLEAFKSLESTKQLKKEATIDVVFWKDEVLDFEENKNQLRIEAIKRNLEHGDRLSYSDKQTMCELMAKEDFDAEITYEDFKEIFKVSIGTIHNWIEAIRAKQKGSKDGWIMHLYKQGYIQSEIESKWNVSHSTISRTTQNFNLEKMGEDYKNGKTVMEIAEYNGLDLQTTWNVLLQESDDLERFKLFGHKDYSNEQPKMYDYWSFPSRDSRIGLEYEGMLWGQHIMNILYRFSKQGDLIIDPMAGGGVTVDGCLIMGRKCRVFDIKPIREDIEQNDIIQGFPDDLKKGDLIILDPPYYKKKEVEYDCEAFTRDRQTYLDSMKIVITHCYNQLKDNKYLAFIMSNYIDYENELESIFLSDYCKLFEEIGFRLVLEIQTPLSSAAQYSAFHVDRAKKQDPWQILPISRSWYIFKKVR